MVQQILLFDPSVMLEELVETSLEEQYPEGQYPEEQYPEEHPIAANTLLEETQQLFQSDGSEPELVALIQKAIDAIHELCDPTNSPD